jgi:hypothetical protein
MPPGPQCEGLFNPSPTREGIYELLRRTGRFAAGNQRLHRDNDGKVIRKSKVDTTSEALESALSEHARELGRIGVEVSSIGI